MIVPREVQAVVFDVDGTLYHQGPLRRAMARKLVTAHALHPVRGRTVMRALGAYRHAQEDLRGGNGGDLAERQLALAAENSGVDIETVRLTVERWMETAPLHVLPRYQRAGLRPSLERLRRAGLRLAVLSDYPADRKLQALGIADLFDVVLCAQDPSVGTFKPHPKGIEVALDCLGVSRDRAVYIGDRPEVDAAAANAAQVACVIITDAPPNSAAAYATVPDFDRLATALGGTR